MFVASFVLSVFCDLFVIDLRFCLCIVHGHATLFVVSHCYWCFMVFFVFASCSCLLCFEGLGNWLGKRTVNGAWGELNET